MPKGVLGHHQGLAHFLRWQRKTFAVAPEDRCAQVTGLSFDVVLRDVFLPLTSGAQLILRPADAQAGQESMLAWLQRKKISLIHAVPSLMQAWLREPGIAKQGASQETSLRWIFFAGEPLQGELVNQVRQYLGENLDIANLYGPTETTLAKCCGIIQRPAPAGVQAVGHSLPQSQALVLTATNQPCGLYEPGQVAIRTPFRTLGYLNMPDEHAKRFIPNPASTDSGDLLYLSGDLGRLRHDGQLELLGRIDQQVKINGVRIEPGEIERLLVAHEAIAEAAVVRREDSEGEWRLTAYLVESALQPEAPTVVEVVPGQLNLVQVRRHLADHLPTAMIPTALVSLSAMPLNANGKIDRRALPAPDKPTKTEYRAPRNALEEQLVAIWSRVLRLDRIGIDDNFFELGGHSLMATQMVHHINSSSTVAINLLDLFRQPTIAEMATFLQRLEKTLADISPETHPTEEEREVISL